MTPVEFHLRFWANSLESGLVSETDPALLREGADEIRRLRGLIAEHRRSVTEALPEGAVLEVGSTADLWSVLDEEMP